MINVQFAASADRWSAYAAPLRAAFSEIGLDVDLRRDHPPETVNYIVYAPNGELSNFTPYTQCNVVLSLWAGVEKIVGNTSLTMPLCRMVDPGLTAGMVEWVTGHVMRYHLDIDRSISMQDRWCPKVPPLAMERPVTVLGLGALGQACAKTLAQLGFPVTGWSRSPKKIKGISCLHGIDGLHRALTAAEILILLLPDTPATENTVNAETLALLPKGARIINPGRGPLIDDSALLAALDSNHVAHATLDVFRIEPLPAGHPYWAHPNVTVTPHIAAETRAVTSARVIAENIRRGEAGEPYLNLVDRTLGY